MDDIRQDIAFFGRSKELCELVQYLQRGRHTIIVGKQGMGKARLMQEAGWILSGRKHHIDFSPLMIAKRRGRLAQPVRPDQYSILRIANVCPHADFLKELLEKLFYNGDFLADAYEERSDWISVKKRLARSSKPKLQGLILETIKDAKRPYLLFFDSLDRIQPGQAAFLEALLNIAILCGAVVQKNDHYSLRKFWSSFTKIDVEPLPDRDAGQLVDYYFDRYRLHIIDRAFYRSEVLKSANGSPHEIKIMLWQGSRENIVDLEEIRRLRRIDAADYFNMGPLYIFLIAGFTVFKLFSIGTDNREFYLFFSALGFVFFLGFRIYRVFFVFRSQRRP